MKLYYKCDNTSQMKEYGSSTKDFNKLTKDLLHYKEKANQSKDFIKLEKHLNNLLKEKGIESKVNKNLSDSEKVKLYIEAINKFQIILPNKKYILIGLDNKGYINKGNNFVIEDDGNLPVDLFKGYWSYQGGKIILDKKRKKYINTY